MYLISQNDIFDLHYQVVRKTENMKNSLFKI